MVCYCCVKGCGNNSNSKKKDPNSAVSFHAFPTNTELKQKWLRAIGRPSWNPPSHTRICSAHFSADQINYDNVRVRIQEKACPVLGLPPNSNFEATHIKVCRICLAIDVKLHSLKTGILAACIVNLAAFNESDMEGLPNFVCYECAALLIKSYNLVEKSMVAQTTLLDIFARHGEITKSLIRNVNREKLNLVSSLQAHTRTPTKIFNYKYDDAENLTNIIINDDEHKYGEDEISQKKSHLNENFEEIAVTGEKDNDIKDDDYKCEDRYSTVEGNDDMLDDDILDEALQSDHSLDDETIALENCHDEFRVENAERKIQNNSAEDITARKNNKKKKIDGLTPDEVNMQAHFKIVKLSMQEQIEEWKKSVAKLGSGKNYVYRCESCCKMFAHLNTYQHHVTGHDPSRGPFECSICHLRFKTDALVRSHAKYAHGKKFYCKSCPKVYNSVTIAKRHYKWHAGHVYKCAQCPFATAHESALGVHARAQHGGCVCARCGRAFLSHAGRALHEARAHRSGQEKNVGEYRCEECDLSFVSEAARRVHLLTYNKHKKSSDMCDPKPEDPALRTTCKSCGLECQSVRDLMEHRRSAHPKKKAVSWSLPGDRYPTQCEHCETVVNNRKEHWSHVRRQHPKQRSSYKPVITAVCDTCGKGFQNPTKLQLHSLRHREPTVRCSLCDKMFYDKHLLRVHLRTHSSARPHACRACGRAFKLRANLERHYRVHTDVASYECTICSKRFKYSTSLNLHVRSVHYKIPPPPRKRKSRRKYENCS